jgi:hypothetical protein
MSCRVRIGPGDFKNHAGFPDRMTFRVDAEVTGFVSGNEDHMVAAMQGNGWGSKQSGDEEIRFSEASLLGQCSLREGLRNRRCKAPTLPF